METRMILFVNSSRKKTKMEERREKIFIGIEEIGR